MTQRGSDHSARIKESWDHRDVEIGNDLVAQLASPPLLVNDLLPSRSRSLRERQPCGRHWSLPHLGQPIDSVRDTLGVVRYQPSESSKASQLQGLFLSLESSPTSAHDYSSDSYFRRFNTYDMGGRSLLCDRRAAVCC